jgi:catalase-peroxidase
MAGAVRRTATRMSASRDTMENPLAAVQMGLIYVNPEGVNGQPDPLKTAAQVRETFARMAMNDEETAALTAAATPSASATATAMPARWARARRRRRREQGFGWINPNLRGKASDAVTSGIEGAWTTIRPSGTWAISTLLFGYEWELKKSPAGAWQWEPVDIKEEDMPVDATDPSIRACRS